MGRAANLDAYLLAVRKYEARRDFIHRRYGTDAAGYPKPLKPEQRAALEEAADEVVAALRTLLQ